MSARASTQPLDRNRAQVLEDVAVVVLRQLVVEDPDREREQREAEDRTERGEESLLHPNLRNANEAYPEACVADATASLASSRPLISEPASRGSGRKKKSEVEADRGDREEGRGEVARAERRPAGPEQRAVEQQRAERDAEA